MGVVDTYQHNKNMEGMAILFVVGIFVVIAIIGLIIYGILTLVGKIKGDDDFASNVIWDMLD